jgi:hypothetical protein
MQCGAIGADSAAVIIDSSDTDNLIQARKLGLYIDRVNKAAYTIWLL